MSGDATSFRQSKMVKHLHMGQLVMAARAACVCCRRLAVTLGRKTKMVKLLHIRLLFGAGLHWNGTRHSLNDLDKDCDGDAKDPVAQSLNEGHFLYAPWRTWRRSSSSRWCWS